ncbi:histidine kinase [Streptomyces sp. LX-29]|uniref:sensor histidine kinase n=1 Tax=Streptomyces sp. LX-29 TaxID=2900152 RepID=UPI00240E7796|nr:histidine kinase [Streptomyces sp. LX-29]WFB10170.1 histidine kinase [Streptomyces sp. LX-29]
MAAGGIRRWVRAGLGRRARLRWVHLILGGALLMPYYLLAGVVLSVVWQAAAPMGGSVARQLVAFGLALPMAAGTALFPLVRPLAAAAARSLCAPRVEPATGPARSWDAHSRTVVWYTLHLALGGVVSGATLAVPPFAAYLLALPFLDSEIEGVSWPGRLADYSAPLCMAAGLGTLAALTAFAAAAGALLARCAPPLLGPTPADRLAAAEERAAELASRNRLARELHDSVGHALSAVTLQASAARKVLDTDPAFARQALAAIEETTRAAVGELDGVLGLLREDDPAGRASADGSPAAVPSPAPTLADLDVLLARTRAAGVTVEAVELARPEALDRLPLLVSREAYRIVQEGLSNALRHAGQVRVRLCVAVRAEGPAAPHPARGAFRPRQELEIRLENPVRGSGRRQRPGGGRGLRGVAERASALRGSADWGAHYGVWRLVVRVPLDSTPDAGGVGGRRSRPARRAA